MTDGIAWLAVPHSIAFGGYSVVLARGLDAEELVSRFTATVFGPARTVRSLGRLTGKELIDAVEDDSWGPCPATGLRHGEVGEWVFLVKYGGRQAEFGSQAPVSRGGAHVFELEFEELEFEEENGKPVPPAGLPDADMPRRDVHRTALEVIERYFGLSLPRSQVLEAALPAVILE
ncbi:hypothetical protein ACFXDH_30085 [Streptomyces sp. NPDC059467]|uniref:hypothetical protein n=1 Tax=Streptomyces sp. NPDC059467 TaxID=3346844 RepID=UPI00369AB596